jgi:hypothetical protein
MRMRDRGGLLIDESGFPRTTTWELVPPVGSDPITDDVPTGGPEAENPAVEPNPPVGTPSGDTHGNGDRPTEQTIEQAFSPRTLAEAFDSEWVKPPAATRDPGRVSDADSRAHVRARRRRAFARYPDAALALGRHDPSLVLRGKGSGARLQLVDEHAACRQPDGYCCPACAAGILGVSRQRLPSLRKAGKLETIGLSVSEYRAARDAAGWTEHEQGWGPGVFYRRADLEGLREAS